MTDTVAFILNFANSMIALLRNTTCGLTALIVLMNIIGGQLREIQKVRWQTIVQGVQRNSPNFDVKYLFNESSDFENENNIGLI